uniref:Uncharacterized protein n=1 Tax=Fagus sylvatica TaxID=28930 RepID=A0A2N9HCR2_FAGSY
MAGPSSFSSAPLITTTSSGGEFEDGVGFEFMMV